MTEADELRAKARDYHEHANSALNPWSKCLLAAIGEEYLERANKVENPPAADGIVDVVPAAG
jgi:hypothetical protein